MSTRPLFEVCVDSLDGVRAAAAAGVERIELCSGLGLGGLSPSLGLLEWTRSHTSLEVFALIRARRGDFVLDADERGQLVRDIEHCRAAGAQGIVAGALRPDGTIDRESTRRFQDAAGDRPLTFHRAFDLSRDPRRSLDDLLELGVPRLLSSGAAPSAPRGAALLRDLIRAAGDALVVMPGGGVRPDNVRALVDDTGAREVHFSASGRWDGPMEFRRPEVAMGAEGMPDEYCRQGARAETLAAYFRAFDES